MFIAWPHSSLILVRGFMGGGTCTSETGLSVCNTGYGSWYPYRRAQQN